MSIVKNTKFSLISQKADKFFYSNFYIALITIIGIIGYIFSLEIYAIYAIVIVAAFNWILCKDLMPSFLAVAILAMTPLARHGEVNFFDPVYYAPIIAVPAFIAHMILFPPKVKLDKFFYTTLAVAIAITLGGVGYLSAKEYFSMPALYYVFGLGFGMVGIYIILQAYVPYDKERIANYFARMMVGIGIMGIAMVAWEYIENGHEIAQNFRRFMRHFQFGNNLSNNLLLSMPFAFYLAVKTSKAAPSVFYFAVGVLQYIAMVLSLSRGGILFSTIVFPFVLLTTFIVAKKHRLKYLIVLVVIAITMLLVLWFWVSPFLENILEIMEVKGNEARVKLYKLAWHNFLEYPIFGKGIAYDGGLYYHPQPWCMYWYHSTLFQILGSLGIVGVIAYGYQEIVRFLTLVNVKSVFNLYTLLSIGGFAAYSMVNVGYFVPLPFVAIVVHMFIVAERYNKILKKNKDLLLEEKIVKRQIIRP